MAFTEIARGENRPTIREVAKVAGVCSMTVSLAMRNHPKISLATRLRVRVAAERLGYTPDPQVAKLMHYLRARKKPRYQSNLCAITTVTEGPDTFYLRDMLQAARERAKSLGFGFEVLRIHDAVAPRSDLQRMLRSRGVEGILLTPMNKPVEKTNLLKWEEFSVIAATHGVKLPDFHRVVPRQFTNMMNLCHQLVDAGYRRIGLALTSAQDEVVHHHFTAAVAWQNLMGGTALIPPLVYRGEGLSDLQRWQRSYKPDVIIVGGEEHARNFSKYLKVRTRKAPLLVASALDISSKARISGIVERPGEIGERAIEQLAAMIQRGEKGIPEVPLVTMVEGFWVDRAGISRGKRRR
jgi:DNA-binding LacI/PurR family transcriptional regulator